MDGTTGLRTATTEEPRDAAPVLDPYLVVRLAGDALDEYRRRVQQQLHGHRGPTGDPHYAARRALHTGADLLTDKQHQRLQSLFAAEEHVEVEATWRIYQRMIAAYRDPDRTKGRALMPALIASVSHGVPAALSELTRLGRTLTKRAVDVLAHFDRPGNSDGPTEAINIWSSRTGVFDVAHEADRVRRRQVIWSMSSTGRRRISLSLLAFPLGSRAPGTRRGHVSDADMQVRRRFARQAPDNGQWTPRAPRRLRPRVPQPDQLHSPIAAGDGGFKPRLHPRMG
jgi:hypothetical protein